jgi:hypothetical protein
MGPKMRGRREYKRYYEERIGIFRPLRFVSN